MDDNDYFWGDLVKVFQTKYETGILENRNSTTRIEFLREFKILLAACKNNDDHFTCNEKYKNIFENKLLWKNLSSGSNGVVKAPNFVFTQVNTREECCKAVIDYIKSNYFRTLDQSIFLKPLHLFMH